MGYKKMSRLQQILYVIAESHRRRMEWIFGKKGSR